MANGKERMIRFLRSKMILSSVFCLLFSVLSGCAGLEETARCTLGVSTKLFEGERKNGIRKTFNCGYKACYDDTKAVLGRIQSYIYAQDEKKGLIAIYVSEIDTTPVGIFLDKIDANNTQLEVVSPSTWAKEFISSKLFLGLEKKLNPETKEGNADAPKKEMGNK